MDGDADVIEWRDKKCGEKYEYFTIIYKWVEIFNFFIHYVNDINVKMGWFHYSVNGNYPEY